jgi:protein involved in polysaccharide export with SLBB domain
MHLVDRNLYRVCMVAIIAYCVLTVTPIALAADTKPAEAVTSVEMLQEPIGPATWLVTPGSEFLVAAWTGQNVHVFTRVLVSANGDVLLPRLGRVDLSDLTVLEALDKLTSAYRVLHRDCAVELVPIKLVEPKSRPFGPTLPQNTVSAPKSPSSVPPTAGTSPTAAPGIEAPPEQMMIPFEPPPLGDVEPTPTPVTAANILASLPRFGADVFMSMHLDVSRSADEAETDGQYAGSPLANVPISPNYLLGPADALRVQVWNLNEIRVEQESTVTADGYITLPVLGKIVLSGKTLGEAQAIIAGRAAEFYSAPQVLVELIRQRTVDVYVIGEVMRRGKFALPGSATLLTALYAAGGPSEVGSYRHVKLLRPSEPEQVVDLYEYLMQGRSDGDLLLQAGDTVFVPPLESEIGLVGTVRRPCRYELTDSVTLADALKMAGGMQPSGYAAGIQVWRADADGMWKMLLAHAGKDGERGRDLQLRDGDLVQVDAVVDRAGNTVELVGPVHRPGIYEVAEGLTVSGLLQQAQGPTEKAHMDQATIWRLNRDFEYEMMRFSIRQVLDGTDDVVLQPRDIVYIYSAADVRLPAVVQIEGQVRHPGEYRFVKGMTVRELVMLAGDLLPGAYTERAEVLRVTSDRRTEMLPVNLLRALDGVSDANISLERGDILQVLAREDVTQPSVAYVDGYVADPGEYHRYEGMRVSDLIVAGGGLKANAGDTIQFTPGRFEGTSKTQELHLALTAEGFSVTPDPILADDDRVGVMGRAEFTTVPKVVTIEGQVRRPGTYALSLEEATQADTIWDLIQRAGGLLDDANPRGMILYRMAEETLPPDRRPDLDYIISILNREAGETSAALSKAQQSDILSSAVSKQIGGLLGTQHGALLVVPPSRINISSWIRAVPIEGERIMAGRGTEDNLKLHHGDILKVPKAVDFVTVIGSVSSPGAVPYLPDKGPISYVNRSGGALPDANMQGIIVVRANGNALPLARVQTVEAGDVVLVPSQHMFRTERVKTPWVESLRQLIGIAAAALLF